MFAAHVSSVLFVTVRMNRLETSTHGSIMPAAPKPNTKYASSNVIAVCDEAFGTAITYAWIGPDVSATVAGPGIVVHDAMNTAELPMSSGTPVTGTVQLSGGESSVQLGSSAIDGMYVMFSVCQVALYMAWMFVHEPAVKNTSVIGLTVLSRSVRPSCSSRFVCVSPAWM